MSHEVFLKVSNYTLNKRESNKHNAELQRTAPGTKDLGAFSLKRYKHFTNIYVCVLCKLGDKQTRK